MPFDLLWIPFLTGLGITLLLALSSTSLFLKGSAWQALALSQWAAVGGVAASALSVTTLPIAFALTGLMMWLLQRFQHYSQTTLASFLLGHALVLLLAANLPRSSLAAANWAEGQLFFVTPNDAIITMVAFISTLFLIRTLKRSWLKTQIRPNIASWTTHSYWQTLIDNTWLVGVIVLGTMILGVPAALSTLVFPAWICATKASNFRRFIHATLALAVGCFILAWVLTLVLDQAFTPILTSTHVIVALSYYVYQKIA